jgi:tetratricopeptide (TPR) repeat protein
VSRVALVILVALTCGCVTEERIREPLLQVKDEKGNVTWISTRRVVNGQQDADYERYTEGDLRQATDAEPENPRNWWMLGDFYERNQRYPEALNAYQKMQETIVAVGRARGMTYAGGLYLVAKAHALNKQWPEAVTHLRRLFELQPSDLINAARVPCFREGHYLMGAIYYMHSEWALAEEHLDTYYRLTHDHARVAGMLARIERELYPERLSPSYARVRKKPLRRPPTSSVRNP